MYLFAFVAGAMAFYFLAAALQRPRPAEILAVILWASYSVYEFLLANGTLCDPYCNIRVDLVLFLPLLATSAILALQKEPRTAAALALGMVCLVIVALLAAAMGYTAVAVAASLAALAAAYFAIKSRSTSRSA